MTPRRHPTDHVGVLAAELRVLDLGVRDPHIGHEHVPESDRQAWRVAVARAVERAPA